MIRIVATLFAASFFAVAALCFMPCPAAASNIFCAASAGVLPLDPATGLISPEQSTTRYAVILGVRGKRTVSASVTFINRKNAYIVDIPTSPIFALKNRHDRYTQAMLVRFAHPTHVRYAYVDTAAVDGAAAITCPTVPLKPIVPRKMTGKEIIGHTSQKFDATFQQALPPLPCGAVYRRTKVLHAGTVYGGDFGLKSRSAVALVALDSRGNSASVKLLKSSGIAQFDQNVLAAAESTKYRPASFLCTPIVSEYIFVGQYSP